MNIEQLATFLNEQRKFLNHSLTGHEDEGAGNE